MEINRILSCLTSEYPNDEEKVEFINKNIISKKDTVIMEYLMSLEPDEIGGLTAISGFFYQFLVTIEYFIELLDDKWDFVAFELHDDIVVGNEREKKIRFIQAKTSKFSSQNPSDVSDLYSGSIKKNKKTNENFRLKDSWVDKLISKAQFFQQKDGYETQFQIYTSYHVLRTDSYNFDNYTDNNNFNKPVKLNDSLVKAIKKNTHNSKFEEVDYVNICGETVEDLLSRLHLKTGSYMVDTNRFINDLRVELSKRIFKDFKHNNIVLEVKDIYLLIGMICSRCKPDGDVRYLKVTKSELESILHEIREQCLKNIEEMNEEHSNKKVIERVINSYLEDIGDAQVYKHFEDHAFTYKEYLHDWISKDGNIRDLFNRYVEGTKKTQAYYKKTQLNRENTIKNLITIIILLNIIYKETLEFGENEFLLTKKAVSNEKEIITLLNSGKAFDYNASLQKLNFIMESADEKEHLFLIDKELKIVLQNYRGKKFIKAERHPLTTKIPVNSVDGLDESSDINRVSVSSIIIPGKILEEEWLELQLLDEFEEFNDEILSIWRTIGEIK
ncbi:DUF4297 domain-containing protein [Cytobacillus firmus]|uniref:DUF4297 domain-containing protein n=1 Tax=Cytobacillus firmus TaxID=1399 RepID=UPI001C939577|nr:DUF4297 domain-containing protein [Cytobacillus firmus]MBY6053431.1 DUF4297 domain-containing protein [Cytobacillus firmus]